MKKRLILFGTIILFLLLFFIILNHTLLKQYSKSFDCLETTCEITIFSKNPKAEKTLNTMVSRYHQLEKERRDELENLQGKSGTIEVSSTLYEWLLLLQKYQLIRNDENLVTLWKENLTQKKIPSDQELQQEVSSLQIVSQNKIHTSSFHLNVDMILSGWLAQEMKQEIENAGFTSYMLNFGGNITVGKHYKDQFTIGLYYPNSKEYLDTITGDYHSVYSVGMNDSIEVQGFAYTPVIRLETRYPYSYYRSVTVIDEDPVKANLLSYLLFTLPFEEGKERVLKENVENVIWIYQDGTTKYLKEK